MRAGELPEERLRLAAQCGHAGASRAVPDAGPRFDVDPAGWQLQMEERHPEVLVWLAAAAAAEAAPAIRDPAERRHLQRAIDAARTWLACPCAPHGDACRELFLAQRCHALGRALSLVLLWTGVSRAQVASQRKLGDALASLLQEAASLGRSQDGGWLGWLTDAFRRREPGELLVGCMVRLAYELLHAPPAALPALREPPTLEDLLGFANDELCDAVYSRLGLYVQDPGEGPRCAAEQVVTRVWTALGVICNGGFEHLFEGALEGDEDYRGTLEALGEIGAVEAREAYREALTLFPGVATASRSDDRASRLGQASEADRQRVNSRFWGGKVELVERLAAYIRAHQSELEELLRARDAWRARRALPLP